MKAFKAPQRSVKIKILLLNKIINNKLIFILIQLSEIHGVGRVNFMNLKKCAQNRDTEVED